ncbi:expressed unknown protein [Seminavis robusta]|uniref:Uncharacterized protein n=1 Tax=Seminavis robusta TaxID=568900 RepID=A0A9N8DQE5_9STRA|nr:expressed unknown protein [Seminavis robusta]|eukprot:Sro265_g102940.1 n/a (567) ;mRNA; f:75282-76982
MERQTSSNASPRSYRSPGSAPSSTSSSAPSSPTTRRRRKAKSGGALFVVLRALAVLGPLGFGANIVYFQFYFPYNNNPDCNPEHVHGVSIRVKGRSPRDNCHDSPTRKMTALEDDDFTDENDHNLPAVLSGTSVLKRLQKQAVSSWQECGSSSKATVALVNQLSGHKQSLRVASPAVLQPFGLKDSLLHLPTETQRRLQGANNSSSSTNGGIEHCQIPQRGSLECQESTYAMIVTFQGEHNFRQLFMNLLAFLTFPSVSDIIVLMPHKYWGYKGHSIVDVKYKERLHAWHNNKQHKVWMHALPPTLENEGRYSFDFIVHKAMARLGSAKAILFMDGSTLWKGNYGGIHTGFELWKQHPHALVAAAAAPIGQEECPQGTSSSSWAAFCQSSSSSIPNEMNKLYRPYQNVLDMNGIFVHRDLLCLLQQPPLSTILIESVWRGLDDSSNDQATSASIRAILGAALLQISGPNPPLLFPPHIARPKNETNEYNDNWHYLAPAKEREWLAALRVNTTWTQQRVLVELLGYFGSGLSTVGHHHAPYWCSNDQKQKGVYFMSDMPWIGPNSKC